VAARERVTSLQEQLQVIERLAVERLDSVRREIILMQKNAEEAISKATAATERRFEAVNEFRAQQADLIKTFATKADIKALTDVLDKLDIREKELEQWRSNTEGRQAVRVILYPVVVGVVVFILSQVMRVLFLRRYHDLSHLARAAAPMGRGSPVLRVHRTRGDGPALSRAVVYGSVRPRVAAITCSHIWPDGPAPPP